MRMLLCVVLLGCLTVLAKAEETKPDTEKPVKVPFVLLPSGHFLVSVKMNDKGPYKLIFDTGAPTMLINNRIAKDSGVLKAKGNSGSMFAFGGMGQNTIQTLEIGGVKADRVSTIVFDHPLVTIFSNVYKKDHGPIDGIVGFPFFARYKMTVDYQAKELTFVPNGYKPADVMQSMMTAMMTASRTKGQPKIVGASALWGMTVQKDKSDEAAGVVLQSVLKDSAAAKAGLQEGDRLLTIDGRWTDSPGDTYLAASFVKPGTTVPVVIQRNGKQQTLKVTPRNGL